MKLATPPPGAHPGRYQVKCASAKAEREWNEFSKRCPDAARESYHRLADEPLSRQPGKQFPLKGKLCKPFWELEATKADRIYYAVCLDTLTVMIAVRNDVHSGTGVARIIKSRATSEIKQATNAKP